MFYVLLTLFALTVIVLIVWQWFRPNLIIKDNDLTYLSKESESDVELLELKDFYWQIQKNQDYQKHHNAPERTVGNGKRIIIFEPLEQEQALCLMRLKNDRVRFFNQEDDLVFSLQMDSQIDAFICSASFPHAYQLMNRIAAILPSHIPLYFAQYGTQFYIYPQDKARIYLLDKNQTHWAL